MNTLLFDLANIGPWLLSLLTQFLYFLVTSCYAILDLAQLLFRLVAGLEIYSLNGEVVEGEVVGAGERLAGSGDMLFQIIKKTFIIGEENYSVIATAFWSLVILASILLVVTTIASIIRSEYSPDKEKKNSKTAAIKNFFKAIVSFVIIPVACYFGLWLGNAVLFAIDSATSTQSVSVLNVDNDVKNMFVASKTSGSMTNFVFAGEAKEINFPSVSGIINRLCLYQSNRIRSSTDFYNNVILASDDTTGKTSNFGVFNKPGSREAAAQVLDDVFMLNARLKTPQNINDELKKSDGQEYVFGDINGQQIEYFDRSNIALVNYYFDINSYNWIVAIVFIFSGGKVLISLTLGLVKRIINMMGLIFINPIIISFMPLDNGSTFTEWRKHFVNRTLNLYISVFVMNIFYMILPIFLTLEFFGKELGWANLVGQSIFIVAALLALNSIEQMIIKILFGKDGISAADEGSSMFDGVVRTGQNVLRTGLTAAHATGHVLGMGGHVIGGLKNATIGIVDRRRARLEHSRAQRSHQNDISDAEITRRATLGAQGERNNILNDVSTQATQDYNNTQTTNMNNAYDTYRSQGGTADRQTWEANTGEGSYAQFFAEGGGNAVAMRRYYNATHDDHSMAAYSNWAREGRQFAANNGITNNSAFRDATAQSATFATNRDTGSTSAADYSARSVANARTAIQTGHATDAQSQHALDRYNNEIQTRVQQEEARRQTAREETRRHLDQEAELRDRSGRRFERARRNVGGVFRNAHDAVDTIGRGRR